MTADDHLPVRVPHDERTLPHMLRRGAARWGGRPLFSCGTETWTYDEAPAIAADMAAQLVEAGVARGDRVAILSRNRAEVMRVLLGCGWLGAVAVPINVASRAPQLRYILDNSGARLLVAEGELLAAVEATAFDGVALREIGSIGDPRHSLVPTGGDGVAPSDPFAILYTSGTTGAPKGVVCPHAQFYWWGAHTSRFLEITEGDVLTTPLPLFHTNAINTFFQALLTGATQHVLPRFSVSDFWPTMSRTNATVTYLLGAMVPMLLSRQTNDAERAHRVRVALAPGVPPHLHDEFHVRTGIRFVDGFGSTETNFVIGGSARERVAGRMGRLSQGISARVVDADGTDVADAAAGELLLKADDPQTFAAGYFGNVGATAQAWRDDWFHTGDRVVRFEDGTFAFLDRLKDSIRRRGENISSVEVEQALASHPAVASVAVFPVPSPLAEDEVMAAIVLKPGAPAAPEQFVAHCEKLLPHFAVPRYIDLVDDLPRTENGKVQKFTLRTRGVTATTWDREASTLSPVSAARPLPLAPNRA